MPSRSTKPSRCQHKPSASCALCRREKNDLQQVGAWARDPSTAMAGARTEPTDYASFVRDTALRTTTKSTSSSSTTHSKKSSSNNHQFQQQPQRIKSNQPVLPIYTSSPKTPTSSVAATRSNSPIAHRPIPVPVSVATSTPRTVPVYQTSATRQPATPGSSKLTATVGATGGKFQPPVMPRTAAVAAAVAPAVARPGSHFVLARGGFRLSGEEEEEEDSEKESEEESEEESESESEDEDEDESDDDEEDDDDDDDDDE